ncbi:M28 family peptidase [bacterium]|nr:M28 family peptidase [bacterium]
MTESFDGKRVRADIDRLCEFGPRPTGSLALNATREFITERLSSLGLTIVQQRFTFSPNSRPGQVVEGVNIIASFWPEADSRILFGTHYDTRPIADRETTPAARAQPILGANDGGSGVAVLLELARFLTKDKLNAEPLGFDFVFFDAEEYVFDPDEDDLIIGSAHFAASLGSKAENYLRAVVVDIVAREGAVYTPDSFTWELATHEAIGLCEAGKRAGGNFETDVLFQVVDDHLPLLDAGIPTALLIDVNDPRWHTLEDKPEYCSANALHMVGNALLYWMSRNRDSANDQQVR